ncbi:hypothetical protein A3A95_00605 [Candidatus Nomurabacteria bacterium RIFCSPLOWO2_01_FULL_39_18]|nr:MAG: hypothetical protein A3A95_00605 [Candidatus Nomurabacteria bacterium RIFCSPLOWO2_01_FULL_39_18]
MHIKPEIKIILSFLLVAVVIVIFVLVTQKSSQTNPLSQDVVSGETSKTQDLQFIFLKIDENHRANPLVKQLALFHKDSLALDNSIIGDYAISPDGQQIFYNLYSYEDKSYNKLYYLKVGMEEPKLIGYANEFDKSLAFPFQVQYWLNDYMVLLATGNFGLDIFDTFAIYDVSTFSGKKLQTVSEIEARPELKNIEHASGVLIKDGLASEVYFLRDVNKSIFILRRLAIGGDKGEQRKLQPIYDTLEITPRSYCADCENSFYTWDYNSGRSIAITVFSRSTKKIYQAWSVNLNNSFKFQKIADIENVVYGEF